MDRNAIVEELYRDKSFHRFAASLAKGYSKDIIQDSVIVLLSYPEEKFKAAHEGGYLRNLFGRIICYTWNNYKAKQARLNTCTLYEEKEEMHPFNDEEQEEIEAWTHEAINYILDNVTKYDNQKDWFDKNILALYVHLGYLNKVEKETGVSLFLIRKSVARAKEKIYNGCIQTVGRHDRFSVAS